jgi:hypothetical protein
MNPELHQSQIQAATSSRLEVSALAFLAKCLMVW